MKSTIYFAAQYLILCFILCSLAACKEKQFAPSTDKAQFKEQFDSLFSVQQREWIKAKIEEDYFLLDKSLVSLMTSAGNGIDSTSAGTYTREYYKSIPGNMLATAAKSIYFDKAGLIGFLNSIPTGLCSDNLLGFRFYLAKYPAGTGPFSGQNTIIVRATCEGKDIAHQVASNGSETAFVAFNFGDVCPPLCDLDNPGTSYSNGQYNTRGNCLGCPQ